MAPAKTIYVKDSDVPLWERFEKAVNDWQRADSVSALIAEAMRQYLAQFGDQGDGLYVMAPDDDPGNVTFGPDRTAIIERAGKDWVLSLDFEGTYPGADEYSHYPLMSRSFWVQAAVESAREIIARVRMDKGMGPLEVMCGDDDHTERFTGRWLVEPDADLTRANATDYDTGNWDAGVYYGVALTRRGQFAAYAAHCNSGNGTLSVYPTWQALEDAGFPPSIIAGARAALTGEDLVIERDI